MRIGKAKRKVLNLFSGIGGHTRNWDRDQYEITHIDFDRQIISVGSELFPEDCWIWGTAENFILKNDINSFDLVFATPPCITHSIQRRYHMDQIAVPDFNNLFGLQEVLKYYFSVKYVFENPGKSWYDRNNYPKPTTKIHRHNFWSNFRISRFEVNHETEGFHKKSQKQLLREYGLEEANDLINSLEGDRLYKRQIARNILIPEIADHILSEAFTEQMSLLAFSGD